MDRSEKLVTYAVAFATLTAGVMMLSLIPAVIQTVTDIVM